VRSDAAVNRPSLPTARPSRGRGKHGCARTETVGTHARARCCLYIGDCAKVMLSNFYPAQQNWPKAVRVLRTLGFETAGLAPSLVVEVAATDGTLSTFIKASKPGSSTVFSAVPAIASCTFVVDGCMDETGRSVRGSTGVSYEMQPLGTPERPQQADERLERKHARTMANACR